MVTLLYDTLSRRMSSGNFSSADSTNANASNRPQNTMTFLNLSILPSNTHPMRIYLLLRVHIEKDFCHTIVHVVSFRSIFRKGRQLNNIPPLCRRSGLWGKQCALCYSAVGLLADEPLFRRRGGILGLYSHPCSSVLSCRSCARMIAANITVHPMTSLTLRTCPRTSNPPTSATPRLGGHIFRR